MPQRNAVRYYVYRNGIQTTDLEVIDVIESAGAAKLDMAKLYYKGLNLEGREFTSGAIIGEEIEIAQQVGPVFGPATDEIVHWGKIAIVPTEVNEDGEELNVVSRADKYLLGERVNGHWVWNPTQAATGGGDLPGGPTIVARDLVFNPLIDGKIEWNENDTYTSGGAGEPGYPLFLDPESVRTPGAVSLQGAHAEEWLLSSCIDYLLQTLNPNETYITNPTITELIAACDDAADVVRNTLIPRGTYLADALDLLLTPLGYRWSMVRTAIGARKFAIYGRNTGALVSFRHQAMGSTLSLGQTNTVGLAINFDVTKLANQITLIGGYYAYEVTVELAKGWPESQDDLAEELMENSSDGFEDRKDAWRKWVLNEAGDYIGVRESLTGMFTAAFRAQLQAEYGDTIWDEFTPCRRKFHPCLTLNTEKVPIGELDGVRVEYRNPDFDTDPSEPEWKVIRGGSVALLEHEAGVRFEGVFPPFNEFSMERSQLRIRVTATLVSDKRIESTAIRQADSPNADVVPLIVDAPTKWRHQVVSPLSQFYASGLPSLDAVDNTEIADFAVRVRDIWDLLDVGGVVQLEGLDRIDDGTGVHGTRYKIGQRVQGVTGKNISFLAKTGSDEYPQIVAIERDVEKQAMTVHLQRFNQAIESGTKINEARGKQQAWRAGAASDAAAMP